MKWVKFETDSKESYGILDGDSIRVTSNGWDDIIAGAPVAETGTVKAADVKLLNPVPRPGKIVAIGLNYLDHCEEANMPVPEKPIVFTKFTTSIIGPGDEIVWSEALSSEVDFEAELAVVIGKICRSVSEDEALDYVCGYTAANDVSARDIQFGDGQWIRGKSLDTFCPMGPALATADSIPDPQALAIRCTLNGKVMQDSSTGLMIFGVAKLLSFCSQTFTLEPGDVILTGTPHGVGQGYKPPIWMKDGDVVVIDIEGVGALENICRTV
jgi:2-keto-4-pentenoate hydratase/2-oxohepta-3-ene-1,7-dioic acid hydratase in catechol pathway